MQRDDDSIGPHADLGSKAAPARRLQSVKQAVDHDVADEDNLIVRFAFAA